MQRFYLIFSRKMSFGPNGSEGHRICSFHIKMPDRTFGFSAHEMIKQATKIKMIQISTRIKCHGG